MKLKPCNRCKSKNLETYDYGYNTFNPGGVRCLDCGYYIMIGICENKNSKSIAAAWNEAKTLQKIMDLKEKLEEKKIYDVKLCGYRV